MHRLAEGCVEPQLILLLSPHPPHPTPPQLLKFKSCKVSDEVAYSDSSAALAKWVFSQERLL